MRHGKKVNHLGRKKGHRRALLMNMACSLIEHKRITTTVAKAKALRVYVEPLITKGKTDTTHNRRTVFSYLQSKYAVTELFGEVATKIGDRPGGYTRIIKLPNRQGDNAEMALIELVDFNELYSTTKKAGSGKKTRRRRGGAKKAGEAATGAAATKEAKADTSAADDLTKIEGIGPKIGEALTAAGIGTYAALAGTDADKIREILDAAEGNFGGHDPATWPEQASMAAAGDWDKLKTWQDELDGGKVVDSSEEE